MLSIREFVLNTAERYYNKSHLDMNNKSEEALSDFVNNSQSLLLQGFLENESNLLLSTKILDEKRRSVVFYKTSAQELTRDDAVKNINIFSLSSNAAESLYQILRQIYSPLLSAGNDLYSSKLQKSLSELESNLRILTHGKGDANMNDRGR
ncbi:uncharacterized protein LOC126366407 [Pectinophora gossypiella]|uniref:uncharacterized protein LOC126366407 n=1 Tax=Pectinophora gossypiella TaxID=13191 RepID=UPI00214ED778|nr:uncharacterized protein LOC126366407 [Pectinophora gossypiella]